jgi:RluA family pseudouridine synthase
MVVSHEREKVFHPTGNDHSITILEDGWYGFCFGPQSSWTLNTSGSDDDTSKFLENSKATLLSLSIVANNDHNSGNVMHDLPFIVHGSALQSLQYGQLLFLKSMSVVSVISSASKVKAGHPNNGNKETESLSESWMWHLVLRHKSPPTVENQPARETGILSDRVKNIVCALCSRTFASVQCVQRHAHYHRTLREKDSIMPLSVVYHDAEMIVIDKPQGIAVQGGGSGKTLQRSDWLLPLAENGRKKPICVHRLDAPTGGLLMLAKNKASERHLRMALAEQKCRKRYRALVLGSISSDEGEISEPIEGKTSLTRYQVVNRTRCPEPISWITTVDCFPVTGRKHQIRRHMKHIGHPIWGDMRYGRQQKKGKEEENNPSVEKLLTISVEQDPYSRLCLWAMEISVPHPTSNQYITVVLPKEPEWISRLLSYQEKLYYDKSFEPGDVTFSPTSSCDNCGDE